MGGINWESIADWVSGIGSLSAAVVALYVAHTTKRIKLRGYCGHRLILGGGKGQIAVFAVSATNVSQRPTVVTNIGFSVGLWRWKRYGVVTFIQDDISQGIPFPLSDGEAGNWNVRLGENKKWARDLIEQFELTNFHVNTMKFEIHTSNGGVTRFRPEKPFRDILKSLIKESKNG